MGRMTISVYVNTDTQKELAEYLDKLDNEGKSRSAFFVEAANEFIKEENNDLINEMNMPKLIEVIRDVVKDELNNQKENKAPMSDIDLAEKLKYMSQGNR